MVRGQREVEHELALGTPGGDVLVRLPGVLERVAGRRRPRAAGRPRGRSSSSSIAGRRPPGSRSACTSQKPMTARDVAISRPGCDRGRRHPGGHPVGDQPAERGQRAQRRVEHPAAGHLEHDVDGAAPVGLDQGVAQVGRVAGDRPRVERDVGAEVAGQVALLRRGGGRDDAPARPARGPAARRGSRRRRLPRARRPSRPAPSGRWCAAGATPWCPAARRRGRWCRRPRPAARTWSPGGPAPARRTRRRAPARRPGARPRRRPTTSAPGTNGSVCGAR